jgi:hypothetical protein
MITSAAALAAALILAATPPERTVPTPAKALTAETVLAWHDDLAKASHLVCRRLLAPTERTREARKACVRETLDAAIASAGTPELITAHTALPKPERYNPILRYRKAAMLARIETALPLPYAQAHAD